MKTIQFGTGFGKFESIVDLYEHLVKQPENICLTHVNGITKEEYKIVKERGVIGWIVR